MGSDVAHWLRVLASAVATAGGVLLLVGDSAGPSCDYAASKSEFDFTSTCPLNVGGAPSLASGHVVLDLQAVSGDRPEGDDALNDFRLAGLNAVDADVHYSTCTEEEPGARLHGVNLWIGRNGVSELECTRLALPVRRAQTVTCTASGDAGPQPATCTITFSPPAG